MRKFNIESWYRFDMLNKRYKKLVLFGSIKLLIITMMHEFIKIYMIWYVFQVKVC